MIGGTKAQRVVQVGEIIGYRAWHRWQYNDRGETKETLRSVSVKGFDWAREGETRADQPPTISNANGLYAFKTLKQAKQQLSHEYIFGKVSMWGQVVEHEDGYRAEYASIDELYEPPKPGSIEYIKATQWENIQFFCLIGLFVMLGVGAMAAAIIL